MYKEHLHIKNMVCARCIRVVQEELSEIGLKVTSIHLGEADVQSSNPIDKSQISTVLERAGFELLEDKNIRMVERIKALLINQIHHSSGELNVNYSDYIAKEIGKDYSYLSSLFSSIENITIEKFIILQKIERVKEWLIYDELTLSEMAFKLGYSSVAHLSGQFKQVTGLTPSAFKKEKKNSRKFLDQIKPTDNK